MRMATKVTTAIFCDDGDPLLILAIGFIDFYRI